MDVLTNIAVFFNVSLDCLAGIDKNEMVSVAGLEEGQKEIIYALINESRGEKAGYPGLTESQQNILNKVMVEFYKKHGR